MLLMASTPTASRASATSLYRLVRQPLRQPLLPSRQQRRHRHARPAPHLSALPFPVVLRSFRSSADPDWIMVWNGYSLVRGLFGVENNMTTPLVDNAITQIATKDLDERTASKVPRKIHAYAR